MKKTIVVRSLGVVGILILTGLFTLPAFAYGGNGGFGQGGHGMRGNGYGMMQTDAQLLNSEEREQYREQHREEMESLSIDERREFARDRREEMRTIRDERRAEMELFIGLSHDELLTLHRDGYTFDEILEKQGITKDTTEAFLTDRLEAQVEMISERHDLDEEKEATLRDRISEVVARMLERWFGA